jgi:hypothetical protein
MQNADGEEQEMRKVWCCKWAGWCFLSSMKQVKSFERRRVMWREYAHHDKSYVLGHVMRMENSHHDQEPGLRSTWLMGWIVGTTGCHACEERTDIYVHYAAPWWEGRHIKKSVDWGVFGGWVEHGYPMGPMMGRENARRLRSLCWKGGSVPRQLFVIHAKEGWTKTSGVVEINTSAYAAQT